MKRLLPRINNFFLGFNFLKICYYEYIIIKLKIMFIGFSILIIGVILLLKNLGFISISAWSIIWPCIIIIFGLSLIFRPSLMQRFKQFKRKGDD